MEIESARLPLARQHRLVLAPFQPMGRPRSTLRDAMTNMKNMRLVFVLAVATFVMLGVSGWFVH